VIESSSVRSMISLFFPVANNIQNNIIIPYLQPFRLASPQRTASSQASIRYAGVNPPKGALEHSILCPYPGRSTRYCKSKSPTCLAYVDIFACRSRLEAVYSVMVHFDKERSRRKGRYHHRNTIVVTLVSQLANLIQGIIRNGVGATA